MCGCGEPPAGHDPKALVRAFRFPNRPDQLTTIAHSMAPREAPQAGRAGRRNRAGAHQRRPLERTAFCRHRSTARLHRKSQVTERHRAAERPSAGHDRQPPPGAAADTTKGDRVDAVRSVVREQAATGTTRRGRREGRLEAYE
jgi:hypothetical protein